MSFISYLKDWIKSTINKEEPIWQQPDVALSIENFGHVLIS